MTVLRIPRVSLLSMQAVIEVGDGDGQRLTLKIDCIIRDPKQIEKRKGRMAVPRR